MRSIWNGNFPRESWKFLRTVTGGMKNGHVPQFAYQQATMGLKSAGRITRSILECCGSKTIPVLSMYLYSKFILGKLRETLRCRFCTLMAKAFRSLEGNIEHLVQEMAGGLLLIPRCDYNPLTSK